MSSSSSSSQTLNVFKRYKIWCNTESTFYETGGWYDSMPTCCPNNSSHTDIDMTKSHWISRKFMNQPTLDDEDGRIIVAPSVLPGTYRAYFCGRADDLASGSLGRGAGTQFVITIGDDEFGAAMTETLDGDTQLTKTKYIDYQFVDPVRIVGGEIKADNVGLYDFAEFELTAPATEIVANGSTTGNVLLVPTGLGFNVIVPTPLSNGTHDLDTTDTYGDNAGLVANALAGFKHISKAVPVPAANNDGFWDWSETDGSVTPNYTQTGKHNLYDVDLPLTKWCREFRLWGPGGQNSDEITMNQRSMVCCPQWVFRVGITWDWKDHAVGDQDLQVVFNLYLGKERSI